LLQVPHVFTQDDLYDSSGFEREAKRFGVSIDGPTLQALHERGHLIPLFRVGDEVSETRKIDIPNGLLGHNPRGWTLRAASEGKLRDPWREGVGVDRPHLRPDGLDPRDWWNGYVYSTWQLLDLFDLKQILAERRYTRGSRPGWHIVDVDLLRRPREARERRGRACALAALSNRYLPTVTRRVTLPGNQWEEWQASRFEDDLPGLLEAVGVEPSDLRRWAEWLLLTAQWHDPVSSLLPLLRHMDFAAWDGLKDAPRVAIWRRIAAEVLLLAHSDLADEGIVDPLPDLSGSMALHPLHGRLRGPELDSNPLDLTLSRFGLSPHPRVLLLVEGETEVEIVDRMLDALGARSSELIRVQSLGGATTNPVLLSRYAVAPRLGKAMADGREFAVPPTVLYVVADDEGAWHGDKRPKTIAAIKNRIRADVMSQGSSIDEETLNFLVHVHVWDGGSFETANFTDLELAEAITSLARTKGVSECDTPAWQRRLNEDIARARRQEGNLDGAVKRARASKPELAHELWRLLERQLSDVDNPTHSPIIDVVIDAVQVANKVPRGTVLLPSDSSAQ
jgi:hypothetical protein